MTDTTAVPGQPPRDEVLDGLVSEWLDIRAEIDKRTNDLADVAALIVERVPDGGKATLPGFVDVGVKVQGPRRGLDKDKAAQLLTPEQLAKATTGLTSEGVRRCGAEGWIIDAIIAVPANGKSSVINLASQRGHRP